MERHQTSDTKFLFIHFELVCRLCCRADAVPLLFTTQPDGIEFPKNA